MKRLLLNSPLYYPCVALLAGAILPLAFAPLGYYPLAVISSAILLHCWLQNPEPRRAFFLGWLYGVGQFGVGVSWVYVSIHVYGETPPWFAATITLLFVAVMALYPAIQGYLFQRLFPRATLSKRLLAYPASWVVAEWLRSVLLTGFPWLLIAYSQTNSPLAAWAPIFGLYGVTFVVTLVSALLLSAKRWPALLALIALLCLSFGLNTIHWTSTKGKPLRVSLVQGNITRSLKWSTEHFQQSLASYQHLTAGAWKSDLIIWPESAVTLPYDIMKDFIDDESQQARAHDATLITGIPYGGDHPGYYYNGMVAVGTGEGRYFKQRLVPFGEYIPLQYWLNALLARFNLPLPTIQPGATRAAYLTTKDVIIAPFICYEIAFSDTVRQDLPRANLLVTISDDAWFGHSLAPAQHVQIAQMQSLQTGRYQLNVTNSGLTAIINDKGQITAQLPAFTQAVLHGSVSAKSGATPWVWWGNSPIFIIVALGALVAWRQSATREKSWPPHSAQEGMGDTI